MQHSKPFSSSGSMDILAKNGWKSQKELFSHLVSLSEIDYVRQDLGTKFVFLSRLQKLINQVEVLGDLTRETRKMVEPGAICESMSSDYLQIRREYLFKRKLLQTELGRIRVMVKHL